MSSPSFDATIDLKLRPSLRALQWLFVLHIVPVALLPLALGPGTPLMLLVMAFGVSWLWLRRHPVFGFGKRALNHLIWREDDNWLVEDVEGRKSEAQLLPSTYVHARLLVLNFKLNSGGKRTRVILGDELGEEPLRRLRARLLSTKS